MTENTHYKCTEFQERAKFCVHY